ncbi:MAG: hypothetical protein ACTH81_04155 [Leuconostoc mesenteroides]
MNMFKSAALFLGTLGIMGATALTVDTPKVSADEATATIRVNTFTPSAGNVYGADTFKESKIGGTWIVKQGIKGIIRNKSAATRIVTETMGSKAGRTFSIYYYDITGGLEPLLSWADLPAQAAFDATLRSLMEAGVTRADATNVAQAIKIAISLFI